MTVIANSVPRSRSLAQLIWLLSNLNFKDGEFPSESQTHGQRHNLCFLPSSTEHPFRSEIVGKNSRTLETGSISTRHNFQGAHRFSRSFASHCVLADTSISVHRPTKHFDFLCVVPFACQYSLCVARASAFLLSLCSGAVVTSPDRATGSHQPSCPYRACACSRISR